MSGSAKEHIFDWVPAHRLTVPNLPHNSLYVISDRGDVVDQRARRDAPPRDDEDYELAVERDRVAAGLADYNCRF